MPTDLIATSPSADQTVGYLLHISETIGRVEGKLDTQGQVTRDLIVHVDTLDTRQKATEQQSVVHEQRIVTLETARAERNGQRWQVRLALIGSLLTLTATATLELARALGAHLPH